MDTSIKASPARLGQAIVCNYLTSRHYDAEHHSACMSKITNDDLTRSGNWQR